MAESFYRLSATIFGPVLPLASIWRETVRSSFCRPGKSRIIFSWKQKLSLNCSCYKLWTYFCRGSWRGRGRICSASLGTPFELPTWPGGAPAITTMIMTMMTMMMTRMMLMMMKMLWGGWPLGEGQWWRTRWLNQDKLHWTGLQLAAPAKRLWLSWKRRWWWSPRAPWCWWWTWWCPSPSRVRRSLTRGSEPGLTCSTEESLYNCHNLVDLLSC